NWSMSSRKRWATSSLKSARNKKQSRRQFAARRKRLTKPWIADWNYLIRRQLMQCLNKHRQLPQSRVLISERATVGRVFAAERVRKRSKYSRRQIIALSSIGFLTHVQRSRARTLSSFTTRMGFRWI